MKKQELREKLKTGIIHIHNDVFPDVEVEEVLPKQSAYLDKALDKYVQYFNYTENQDKYNLRYCFKTTINDLNNFYEYQEGKLESIRSNDSLCDIEHRVNEHIYDEVILCQKRVNRIYLANMFVSYFLAFLLLFGVNQVMHVFELSTLFGSSMMALIMAFVKLVIDKKYLERIRKKVGWKSYRIAVKRSLAFYFTSLIVLTHCEHMDLRHVNDAVLVELKTQVDNTINILLTDIII